MYFCVGLRLRIRGNFFKVLNHIICHSKLGQFKSDGR